MNLKILIIMISLLLIGAVFSFNYVMDVKENKIKTYINWDAWETAKDNCHKEVRDFIQKSPGFCNVSDCKLLELEYDSLYWKSIVCSDNVKIEDYEKRIAGVRKR